MHPAPSEDRRPVVLLVDDDPDLRTLVRMQLTDAFEVVPAPDGEECLRLVSEREPDVILLDVMMPGMDGSDVLRALSAQPETRDIPVILLSALDATEDRVRGLEGGAVDYVSKPFEPRELKARIRRKLHVAPETRLGDFVKEHLNELHDRWDATVAEDPKRA